MKITVSQLRKIIREEIVRSHSQKLNEGFWDTAKQKLGIGGKKLVQFDPETAGKPGTDLPKRPEPSKEELEKSRQETAEKNEKMNAADKKIYNAVIEIIGNESIEILTISNGKVVLRLGVESITDLSDPSILGKIKQLPDVKQVQFA